MNEALSITSPPNKFMDEVAARSGQPIKSCYQCGNCSAGCPAAFAYDLQANQVMRAIQLNQKDLVFGSRSIWMCLSCSTCSLRCPNNIDVAHVMDTLRHMAREENRISEPAVNKFWVSFLDTVRVFGRSFEIGTMVLFMMRSLRVFTDVDLAPAALAKRKLGFIPHSIPGGAAAVTRIFTRFTERLENKQKAAANPGHAIGQNTEQNAGRQA